MPELQPCVVQRISLASALIISALILPAAGLEVVYSRVIEYPRLEHPPSYAVVDEAGRLWFALPTLESVALYVPDVGVNLVGLGFAASDLSYGRGSVVAYSAGSREVAFLDAGTGRVSRSWLEPGDLDTVFPMEGGFVFVERSALTGEALVVHVSESGEVRWRWRIEGRRLAAYKTATGSGRSVWLSTSDGAIIHIEVGKEVYREFRLGGGVVAMASRDGKAWVIRADGVITRLSPGGVEARFETGLTFRVGDAAIALPGDRLVVLSRIDRVWVEIEGEKVSRLSLPYPFTQVALRGVSEIYLVDSTERRILVAPVSRRPVIYDYRVEAGDGVVRVFARVSDPDEDLEEGYPVAVAVVGGQSTSIQMKPWGGGYSAELRVPGGSGVMRVYVRAKDLGGNEESVEVGSFQVLGGSIAGEATAQASGGLETRAPPPATTSIQSILPMTVELLLLTVMLGALVVFALGRSRRSRRRRS